MSAGQFPATRTIFCPGEVVHCCAKHAAKLMGVMTFRGAQTMAGPAPDGAQCEGCKTESDTEAKS